MKYFVSYLLFVFIAFGCVNTEKNVEQKEQVNQQFGENPAAIATKNNGAWWNKRHQTILSRLNPNAEMILVGNSIFNMLDNEDRRAVWETYLDAYKTINMGISGDRTENVIWRLENGALENIQPKVAVVLIGTNNTDGNHYLHISSPEELAGGIQKICSIIHEKLPTTNILLMGILPYGYKPNYRDNINKATNQLIAKFPDEHPFIHYVDIGAIYCDENGMVRKELMPDYLHPSPEGHLLMFKALEPHIKKLMNP